MSGVAALRMPVALAAALLAVPGMADGQETSAPPAANGSTQAGEQTKHRHAHEEPQAASPSHEHHPAHEQQPEEQPYPPGIPAISDEDRAAAFPDLNGQHTVHDDTLHYYVLFDQLEWRAGDGVTGLSWDNKGWIGWDVNRFWFRTEGEGDAGDLAGAEVHALYGRAIHPWWDLVLGVRQDIRPGPARTWAAVGIQGLAPYWFEVEATAYLGASGRTQFRFETEYELLLTNRLVLQPLLETQVYGKSDPEHGIGAGLSSADLGLRLRYEIRRELAPYLGVTWHRKFFGTADLAEAARDGTAGTQLAIGVRVWF